jgi:uncharacterized membrane protein YeaQ/YmgE (transglycosylase-associated protein family)
LAISRGGFGDHVNQAEICKELGLDATDVADVLSTLSTTNLVSRASTGNWQLTPAGGGRWRPPTGDERVGAPKARSGAHEGVRSPPGTGTLEELQEGPNMVQHSRMGLGRLEFDRGGNLDVPMSLLLYLVIAAIGGLFVGALGRLLLPGRDPMTVLQTMAVGIAGSLAASLVVWALTGHLRGAGLILSVLAATAIVYAIRRARGGTLLRPAPRRR